ncbi:hypothetical protein BJX65DRAFT_242528 [Aspergillus insuetus]
MYVICLEWIFLATPTKTPSNVYQSYIVLRFFELLSACFRHCTFFRVLLHVHGLRHASNHQSMLDSYSIGVYSGNHVPSSLTPTSGLLALNQARANICLADRDAQQMVLFGFMTPHRVVTKFMPRLTIVELTGQSGMGRTHDVPPASSGTKVSCLGWIMDLREARTMRPLPKYEVEYFARIDCRI